MLQLVDYGSESDEDIADEQSPVCGVIVTPKAPNAPSPRKNTHATDAVFDPEDSFDVGNDAELDSLISISRSDKVASAPEEGELEEFLKARRDWEKEAAQKNLQKKNKKNRRINAFGALGSLPAIGSLPTDDDLDGEERAS